MGLDAPSLEEAAGCVIEKKVLNRMVENPIKNMLKRPAKDEESVR